MPQRVKDYATKQGVDLAPANSAWSASRNVQMDWGGTPPPATSQEKTRTQAAPATSTPKPTTQVPQQAVDYLRQNSSDPNTLNFFKQKYGVDPSAYLNG